MSSKCGESPPSPAENPAELSDKARECANRIGAVLELFGLNAIERLAVLATVIKNDPTITLAGLRAAADIVDLAIEHEEKP
jgi:hypothetical protein